MKSFQESRQALGVNKPRVIRKQPAVLKNLSDFSKQGKKDLLIFRCIWSENWSMSSDSELDDLNQHYRNRK